MNHISYRFLRNLASIFILAKIINLMFFCCCVCGLIYIIQKHCLWALIHPLVYFWYDNIITRDLILRCLMISYCPIRFKVSPSRISLKSLHIQNICPHACVPRIALNRGKVLHDLLCYRGVHRFLVSFFLCVCVWGVVSSQRSKEFLFC